MDTGHKTANQLFKISSCRLAMPHRFALRLTKLSSKIVIEVRRCEKKTPSRPPLYMSFLNIDVFQISLLFLHLGLVGLLLCLTSYMHGVVQLLVCIWYIKRNCKIQVYQQASIAPIRVYISIGTNELKVCLLSHYCNCCNCADQ